MRPEILLAGVSACLARSLNAGTIALTGDAVVVVPSTMGTGLTMALRDVQRDMYSVLGLTPVVTNAPPARGSLPAGTTVVMMGQVSAPGYDTTGCSTGWESHCVKVQPASSSPSGYDTIIATGNDDRGCIFAAYSFSEVVLGIHPLKRFIDFEPVYQPSIAVNASLAAIYPPPVYTHRSIFPNDEDLLGGHRPDPLGRGVFSADAWDALLETALRLKLNGALVGTNPFADDDNVALVARRGMVVHHHHYNLLGSNTFVWPLEGGDWDWRKNPGTMAYMWRAAIQAQAALPEVVWSLGLRGLNDGSYSACTGQEDCGRQISEVLSNQTAWLAEAGVPDAPRVLYLWQELLPYITSGDLIIPNGTEIIFTDSGAGFINVNSDVSVYADGFYYHTAMYDGVGNQLTEMVPGDRIIQQLLNFTKNAKTTTHAIINLSDLRPVPMTTQLWAQIVWDAAPFAADEPHAAALQAYARFATDACGLPQSESGAFASMWAAYFAIPFIQSGQAENYMAGAIRSLGPSAAQAIASGNAIPGSVVQSAKGALGNLGGNTTHVSALAALAQAQALLASVPASRAAFFSAHSVLNMATIGYSAQALYDMATAVITLAEGGNGAQAAALALAQQAEAAMETLLALRRSTEIGQWSGYYSTDHLSDMQLARKAARQFALALSSPAGTPLAPLTPYIWYHDFEAWQVPLTANYPLSRFTPQWNMPTWVRINCVFANQTAGICNNNPLGGSFTPGSQAAVTMQVLTSYTGVPEQDGEGAAPLGDSLTIRYTLDGTDPTPASPTYPQGGLPLSPLGSSAHIRAKAWVNGVESVQVTDVVYAAAK